MDLADLKKLIKERGRIMGAENECAARHLSMKDHAGKIVEVLLPQELSWRCFQQNHYAILENQGRAYPDSNTLEFCTPECLGGEELALYETANLTSATECAGRLRKEGEIYRKVSLHKTDRNCERWLVEGYPILEKNLPKQKLHCGSTHGNYLTLRAVSPITFMKKIRPFLEVARWVLIGNGWIEITEDKYLRFVLSQNAGLIEQVEAGSSTSLKPLFSTKDEPHANQEYWRRFHDISGNQTISQSQLLLKHVTMDIVMLMIEEEDFLGELPQIKDARMEQYPTDANKQLQKTLNFFNADIFGLKKVKLADGSRWSAVDFNRYFIEKAEQYFLENPNALTADRKRGLELWTAVVDALAKKDLPFLARHLDWAAILYYFFIPRIKKLGLNWRSLIRSKEERKTAPGIFYDLNLATKRGVENLLAHFLMVFVNYAGVDTGKSLYGHLLQNQKMEQIFSPEEISRALSFPPQKTRASYRETFFQWIKTKTKLSLCGTDWEYVLISTGNVTSQHICKDPYGVEVEEIKNNKINSLLCLPGVDISEFIL